MVATALRAESKSDYRAGRGRRKYPNRSTPLIICYVQTTITSSDTPLLNSILVSTPSDLGPARRNLLPYPLRPDRWANASIGTLTSGPHRLLS